ncbi:polyadenylate-binding protein 4-like [Neoarius graeffei]|uniref:polyadenylate-binding protein 4-like n=1 Tax=Neoarius graeffei TaxID=443677 RepID=UPI00298D3C4A|nr:polyadenylate-binding protein 4-like [Neoarius graeffei]
MTSLYVGDLQPDVTEMMLVEMVSRAGPVHSVHMCRDKKTFSSRGDTFANFLHRADAERALESVPAVETAAVGDSSPVVVPVSAAKELPATTDAVPPTAVSPVSEVQPDKDATDGPTSPSAGKRLTIYMLESCPVDEQVQMAREFHTHTRIKNTHQHLAHTHSCSAAQHDHLLPLVEKIHPNLANKITWMLAGNQNNYEIMNMISDPELLYAKVDEMDAILKAREAGLKLEAIKMLFGDENKKRRKKKNRF